MELLCIMTAWPSHGSMHAAESHKRARTHVKVKLVKSEHGCIDVNFLVGVTYSSYMQGVHCKVTHGGNWLKDTTGL